MIRLPRFVKKTLSVRLSLGAVSAMAILLMASLAIMLHYSRKSIKEEAISKASQTLEGTVTHIDNMLLSVEQTAGNFYFLMLNDKNHLDKISTYCRQLVESNPYVAGCAFAFKPGYIKEQDYFINYVYRTANGDLAFEDTPIIQSDLYGNMPYTEQVWFREPMSSNTPQWFHSSNQQGLSTALKDNGNSNVVPVITFSLPIPGIDGFPVGVIAIDVSLNQLAKIIEAAKPSPNSHCALLDNNGSFIVLPDSSNLVYQTALAISENVADPSAKEAVQSMLSGKTDYQPFSMNGAEYYIFYKPFKRFDVSVRSRNEMGWSAGIIYPSDDIFGDYNNLSYYVFAIAIVGLLLFFMLCRAILHHQLKPLLMLSVSAKRIADGHYDETIPDSRHHDEIGRLQSIFQQMQQSLAINISELEQLTATLQERGEGLRAAYNHAKKADRMKTAFLHNMTNQMIAPANAINDDVEELCKFIRNKEEHEVSRLANEIQQSSKVITEQLKNLINVSDDEIGKEANNV